MKKEMTCIECPVGCALSVDIENCKVVKVSGGKCPKAEKYAISEVENPVRILTSTVLTDGLSFKMIPVRTDRPLPKRDILRAAEEIKKVRINKPTRAGEIIVKNFLNPGTNLIATRDCS